MRQGLPPDGLGPAVMLVADTMAAASGNPSPVNSATLAFSVSLRAAVILFEMLMWWEWEMWM